MPDTAPNGPQPTSPGFDAWDMPLNPLFYLQHPILLLYNPIALVAGGLWIWMLIHCARHDPERNLWLWILFIGNVPAAVIYFLVRWLPGARLSSGPSLMAKWSKRRQIPRLEVAARNIGNAHQFVELGEAYRETGKTDRAADCFHRALQKDPANMPALWGAAQTQMQRQNFAAARPHLEGILAKDGTYKFGDVSLAYCRTLVNLNDSDAAFERLEQHLKRWTHPEAYVLIASLLIDRGQHALARERLESTLSDLQGGPAFFARQNRSWARKARRLLGRLPRA
ncbi:MAG TPA: tetratricopeptide repeat protein [Planctomycetaceae bacterium]|nr:tetratricopeptide repeat protein [Planctomycetaceae bacterium]